MRVHFSTDDLPPRDRVDFWCDYFAKLADKLRANLRCSISNRDSRGFGAPPPTSPETRPKRSSSGDSGGR